MTRNTKIQDLLYFQGINADKYQNILYRKLSDKEIMKKDFNIIISVIN